MWVVVATGVVGGCAASITRPAAEPLGTVQVSPRHVNIRPSAKDDGKGAASMAYLFPVIEGQIFGQPTGEALVIEDDLRNSFSLPLDRFMQIAPTAARPLSADAMAAGMEIAPRNTALLRIGTYLMDPVQQKMVLADVHFRDSLEDVPLILVYVDRPCRIRGTLRGVTEVGADAIVVKADLDSRGFHWLSLLPNGDGRAILREHARTDAVLLVVQPPAARRLAAGLPRSRPGT